MSSESPRRAAREHVAAYHETQLAELIDHLDRAIGQFRAGELDVFETDHAVFQYSRAAKELWKFCNLPDAEFTASLIHEGVIDWWERGAPRRR